MSTRGMVFSMLCAAALVAVSTSTPVLARSGGWYAHQTTKFMMDNGSNVSINTLKRARANEDRSNVTRGRVASAAGLPSPLPITRENASETTVREGLQQLGYTDIRNLRCSGSVCDAVAVWGGEPYDLRIESDTGKIRNDV